ncbi:MAG TPA: 2-C-methyl-D-erythritol 4-phosphate cytidylyltransferase, partial [Xanthobacteraceae bacterium]|nr:2-C-methyl-D-erythritol 4-phosphate cytidylyltransferase [Xanthobacteraceae bacterium]
MNAMPGGVAAVVVAAGRGVRAGHATPKQYRNVRGAPVIRHALSLFIDHPQVTLIQPVIHRDDAAAFAEATAGLKVRAHAFGGATRQISVLAGLEALETEHPRIVLVHDAARPFASPALISRAIAAGAGGAAIPGVALTDTIKEADADGRVARTLDRG